jgi:hypothetical protein
VTVGSPPLAQWQIDHIRKMQEELGSPNTEEVTMDEDLGALGTVADVDAADAADAETGGLSVYPDPAVRSAMANLDKLAKEQTARYDALEKALAEKRYGPSFSERMFQLSAALAQPTTRRGFGGVLENITPVLAAQQKAQREGNISRREALDKLSADRLAQQVGLAKQGLTTATAMARINATANKPVRGVPVGDTLRNPYTNEVMGPEFNRVPKPEYYKALEAAPTPENLQAAVAYYPTFAVDLKAAYERGLRNKGR